MIVLKFGGTSVGTADAIKKVGQIVLEKTGERQLTAVVSAVGGVTNKLQKAADLASQGKDKYELVLKDIEDQHLHLVRELMPIKSQSGLLSHVKILINELEEVLKSISSLMEISIRANDYVLSFGERLSSKIIYCYFQTLSENVFLIDPTTIIKCDANHGRGNVDLKKSENLASEYLKRLDTINICPGFIAGSPKKDIITLGRGGSDYTAALLANFWDADVLEIWTDVSGLMTADHRLVSASVVIPNLSYEEALELSHFGAKVIYPPSIQPALEKEIPILIKNTFASGEQGTRIIKDWEDGQTIRGISSINSIALLNLSGSGMVGIPNFSFRLFQALSHEQINVILITQASSEHSISVAIESADGKKAEKIINQTFKSEIQQHRVNPVEVEIDLSILALVGTNMRNQVGVGGQLFSALARNGISVKAIAQGSSERNISLVVASSNVRKALNTVHESFFTEEQKKVNLFVVGVGHVGKALLQQVAKQQEFLRSRYNLVLNVVAIANSKKVICDANGIDLTKWETLLEDGVTFKSKGFVSDIRTMNLRNSVFLDITGSEQIAELYLDVLKSSISVVTPNKIGATDTFSRYVDLKRAERKYKTRFLFETNVCAGLPVISTLEDLVKSGDQIHRIEAVLSGTLNFLFNTYDGIRPFAEVVRQAREEGYSEPDPRLDLSGEDVRRKILILTRESGYEMEMEQVESESFVPDESMSADSVETFFDSIEKHEGHFKQILEKAKNAQARIRYVARFENGKASTKLEFVDSEHPFYHLDGKDNIVLFFTDRYQDQPLVVKGAGAGAQVTASGIFADIMKVANAHD